ncbi:MAG: DUF480 domain-containing protein [Nitriliruptor sp.]|nr:MAG: DUF480 domain-containing protein [Nitriliruptor sp.]
MDLRREPLSEVQLRVLGVLVEKQLATPDSYPLTEKALLAGCNQSTNRDPVVSYDTTVLRPALIRLRERALTRRVLRAGERAEKHAHRLDEQLQLSSTAPLAVLSVLLLRGAQTPGELRARTQRLHPIADAAALEAALAELSDRGLAEQLPRRPGEKQARWRHLLGASEPGAAPTPSDGVARTGPSPLPRGRDGGDEPGNGAGPSEPATPSTASEGDASVTELAAAVRALTRRVAALERELGIPDPSSSSDDLA